MSGRARILLTNDDGIDSEGLAPLASALAEDHDVVVAVPASNVSGCGTAVGQFDPDAGITLEQRSVGGVEGYAIDGTPGLAVMAGVLGAFGTPPELVVSGPNAGPNTGHAIIQSGTVGGALTAQTFGLRGLAISLMPSDPWHWDTAVRAAVNAVRWLLEQEPPTTLNVNAPACPPDEVAGAVWAPLDRYGHFQTATADVDTETLLLEWADHTSDRDADCDTARMLAGYVTLTPLRHVVAAPFPDVDPAAVALA